MRRRFEDSLRTESRSYFVCQNKTVRRLCRCRCGGAGYGGDDLFAVETAIFDEDFAGVIAAYDDAREINAWDVAFERLRIQRGLVGLRIELNAELAQERKIRVIARERENLNCG